MATATWVNDPGHGWLSMSIEDFVKLGIADKITSFSYIGYNRVYLEEDCDAGTAIKAGFASPKKQVISRGYSSIRTKTWYSESTLKKLLAFKTLMEMTPTNINMPDGRIYRVTGIQGSKVFVAGYRNQSTTDVIVGFISKSASITC